MYLSLERFRWVQHLPIGVPIEIHKGWWVDLTAPSRLEGSKLGSWWLVGWLRKGSFNTPFPPEIVKSLSPKNHRTTKRGPKTSYFSSVKYITRLKGVNKNQKWHTPMWFSAIFFRHHDSILIGGYKPPQLNTHWFWAVFFGATHVARRPCRWGTRNVHLCWPQSEAPPRAGEVFLGVGGWGGWDFPRWRVLGCPLEVRINGDRINGLFHLLINSFKWDILGLQRTKMKGGSTRTMDSSRLFCS